MKHTSFVAFLLIKRDKIFQKLKKVFIHSLMSLQDRKLSLMEKYQWDNYFDCLNKGLSYIHMFLLIFFRI